MIRNPSTCNEVFTHINISTQVNQLNELPEISQNKPKNVQKFSPLILCGPSGIIIQTIFLSIKLIH